MIHDRNTYIFLLKTHKLAYFSYYQQGRKHSRNCCHPNLTGPTASPTSENRVLPLFLERKCSQAPQQQIFVLHKVLILLTLKSLICKNSSMIDLHFLSISSSDSEGFSCTGAGGASGLTGRNKKKSIWKW